MTTMQVVNNVLLMLGGIVVFMYGMRIMSENLERAAGGKMRTMLGKMTSNRFVGVGVGTAVTAIIQASAATTVMAIGFVNIGMITLTQAAAVIMGANIGTTVTAQIAAFSGSGGSLGITAICSLIACTGLIMNMVCKKDLVKRIGSICIGLGMLFIGLDIMKNSMGEFKDSVFVQKLFSVDAKIVLILAGLIVTALIQSSSAVTTIIIGMAGTGLLSLSNSIFIILGSNIGTCVTAMIASIGTNVNARRTAVIHLLFNVFGCLIFGIPLMFPAVIDWTCSILTTMGGTVERQIANFHTIFNLITTIIMLPLINVLTRLACLLVRDKGKSEGRSVLLDKRLLQTPAVAVSQVKREITAMINLSFDNYRNAMEMLLTGNMHKENDIMAAEEKIDILNREITAFCVKISSLDVSDSDEQLVASYYHVISDAERISDYAISIMGNAKKMNEHNLSLSNDAVNEIKQINEQMELLFNLVLQSFEHRDWSLNDKIIETRNSVYVLRREMADKHIERLKQGLCTPEIGSIYLPLAGNFERIAGHLRNISKSVKYSYGYSGQKVGTENNKYKLEEGNAAK